MRVYLPHCAGMLRPEVPAKLDELGVHYELVEHSKEDDSAYPRLFCEWWRRGETFAIIEQDNLVHDQVFATWETCGHACCGFPYTVGPRSPTWPWLGCTRFDASLIARYPELAFEANNNTTPGWPAWHWKIMDLRVKQELRARGLDIVSHSPPITHLHYEAVPVT